MIWLSAPEILMDGIASTLLEIHVYLRKYGRIIMRSSIPDNEFADMKPLRATLLCLVLCATAPSPTDASAQAAAPPRPPTAPNTVEGVTVVASPRDAAQLPSLVTTFVRAHGQPGRIDQLSRWAGPLCPKTEGLAAAFDAFVSARVTQVALAVGAPRPARRSRGAACKTNVLIVFTTKPEALLDDVRRHHPQMLGFHYAAQAERLARFNRPIQAWYMTATGGRGDNPEPDNEFGRMPGGSAGSRLSAKLTSQFMGVLVVVDANQVIGRQIGGVADNVAMLALARSATGPRCSGLPTILDTMTAGCATAHDLVEMTPYDVAYLKGLYSVDPEEYLAAQRSEIGSHMLRELTTTPEPPQPPLAHP